MKGRGIKIKYANGGRMAENNIRYNYRFILPMRVPHFRSISNTVSIPKDLVVSVIGELVAADMAFLMCQVDFTKKFSAALGSLSGVMASFLCPLFHG
jgi:hypothetical protein